MRRRSFMSSLGAGAGLGLLGQTGLFGGRASADCGATPKRLLVVVSSHGNYAPGYRLPLGSVREPICSDGPDREVSLHGLDEDELSPILQPLHAYRDRMLALDGLTMTSAWVNRLPSPFNEHNRGQLHALTGANGTVRDGVVVSSGASLDQIVGSVNHRQSTRTSLNVGIRTIGTTPISYRLDRSPVGSAQSPRDVFDALFGSAPPPRTDVRATRVASGRARLFRALDREYSLARDAHALGRADLDRLAAHRELIANVAASLDTDEVLCGAGAALPDAPPTGSSPP
ncbi:MAG: DUF1552 domain-containing protein, partial [Deltaproteobacteria bacterium]|nr:DUF1552 domain-containing protein [Deltaproteobacteria bacterium]